MRLLSCVPILSGESFPRRRKGGANRFGLHRSLCGFAADRDRRPPFRFCKEEKSGCGGEAPLRNPSLQTSNNQRAPARQNLQQSVSPKVFLAKRRNNQRFPTGSLTTLHCLSAFRLHRRRRRQLRTQPPGLLQTSKLLNFQASTKKPLAWGQGLFGSAGGSLRAP